MFDVASLNLRIPQVPRGGRLLVLPLVKAGSSFILDTEENREQPEKGLVIAVGPPGVGPESGRLIQVDARLGELVCYGKYAGLKFAIRHEIGGYATDLTVFVMRDTEILLAQPPETLELVIHDGDPRKIHEAGLTCEYCERAPVNLDALKDVAYGAPSDVEVDAPADLDAAIDAERARATVGPSLSNPF